MIKVCVNDLVEFESKRNDARFCSAKCRVEYGRKTADKPQYELPPKQMYGEPIEIDMANKTLVMEKPEPYEDNPFKRKDPDYDYEKNLKAFKKMGLDTVKWISTGMKDFDALTKIPRGRITQIQGPLGVGKTTLVLNMIAGMKRTRTLYIDAEASLNPELMTLLHIDSDYFTLYNKSADVEDIAPVIQDAAKSGDYDLIVLDSVDLMTTKTEYEGKVTDRNIGQKAFFMGKLVRMVQMDLKNKDTAFVVINKEKEVIGSYVPTKYTPGGQAVPSAASLIVSLKTIKSQRFPKSATNGIYLGHEVDATIIKSKVNTPWRKASFKLYYPDPKAIDEF